MNRFDLSANRSVKIALTVRLSIGLTLLGVIGAVAAYLIGTSFANRAFDRSLFDDVKVLADQVRWVEGGTRISLTPDALVWLLADEGDEVIFRVTDLTDKRVLTSNGNLGDMPDLDIGRDQPYFRSIAVGEEQLRVAYVVREVGPAGASALVEIGETTRKRKDIGRSILFGSISLMLVFSLMSIGLVWTGVRMALMPLQRVEAEAAGRSITNMEPLDLGNAPSEVRGLIEAFNHMMSRVSQAIEAQRQFLANAAHQLKTPMAGMRLQAQLAMTADSLDAAHGNMRSVERRAAHSAHLIDQLLSLAQAESGEAGLQNTRCDLALVARDVIERMLPAARAHQVDLGYETGGADKILDANPVLLGELMTNLVDNALRYGRPHGRVTLRLERTDTAIVLSVEDDGDGFPEATRELVFRRFWRSDASSFEGAGLGLAIVKEIAERYGGVVSIVTRPTFDGTRIDVAFPVR